MTAKIDIINKINGMFPPEKACDFDNVGVLAGDVDGPVSKVMLTLDVTTPVINECIEKGCNLLISHHPVIFGGIKNVNCDNATGSRIWKLASAGITCMAAHTNLDVTSECSNALLAYKLGCEKDAWMAPEGTEYGVAFKIEPVTLSEFAGRTLEALGGTGVIYYADPSKTCSKIFAQGGSFDEDCIPVIRKLGIDTVVSGEIKHHIMYELAEYGIAGVIAGHRETERIFMPYLASLLKKSFPDVEFLVSL